MSNPPEGTTSRRSGGGRGVAPAAVLFMAAGGLVLAVVAGPEPLAAQEAGQGAYRVERGDTLWDIAERLLNDPFRWQGIWKANQDRIDDPDLIFPGQRFQIPGRMAEGGGETDETGQRQARTAGARGQQPAEREPAGQRRAAAAADTVPPARASLFDSGRPTGGISSGGGFSAESRPPMHPVTRNEVLGAPFLARRREIGPAGRILGPATAGDRPVEAWQGRTGDEVRLSLSGIQASPGDTLFAVEFGRSLAERGRAVHTTGVLSVEEVRGDTAVAMVGDVFGLVRDGETVVRTEVPSAPDATEFRAADRDLRTTVLTSADGSALLREGGLVFLDRGSSDGVRIGDLFLAAPGESTAERAGRTGARVLVVRVRPGTSTARVVYPGDGTVSHGATARLVQRLSASGR